MSKSENELFIKGGNWKMRASERGNDQRNSSSCLAQRTATLGSNLNISTAIRMVRAYDVENSGSPESAAFPNSSKLKILYNGISVLLYVKRAVLTARLEVGKQHNWTTCGCALKKERLPVNYPPTILEQQQNVYRTFRKRSLLMYNQSPGAALLVLATKEFPQLCREGVNAYWCPDLWQQLLIPRGVSTDISVFS